MGHGQDLAELEQHREQFGDGNDDAGQAEETIEDDDPVHPAGPGDRMRVATKSDNSIVENVFVANVMRRLPQSTWENLRPRKCC